MNMYPTYVKVSIKIAALARTFRYVTEKQRRKLINAYSMSRFGYCPFVWISYNRSLNNHIDILHERVLSLVYNNFIFSFAKLLEKTDSVTIHQRNLQTLAIEMFQVKKDLLPEILNNDFKLNNRFYNTRNNSGFQRRNVKAVLYESETLSSLGSLSVGYCVAKYKKPSIT